MHSHAYLNKVARQLSKAPDAMNHSASAALVGLDLHFHTLAKRRLYGRWAPVVRRMDKCESNPCSFNLSVDGCAIRDHQVELRSRRQAAFLPFGHQTIFRSSRLGHFC